MKNTALNLQDFGARLRTARGERGLTQAALAAHMGVGQGWLSRLERGQQTHIQADTVVRLCQALHISADYLCGLGETLPGHLMYDETTAQTLQQQQLWQQCPLRQAQAWRSGHKDCSRETVCLS